MGHPSTPQTFLDLATFISQCAAYSCVPILQINAAIAMIYGADASADLTAAVLRDFAAAGISVRYLEFGNELYGVWWPAGAHLPRRTGGSYAQSFVAMRAALLERLPGAALSFGVVMTHLGAEESEGNLIGRWNDDIASSTYKAASLADWLILHRYFSRVHQGSNLVRAHAFTPCVALRL